MLRKWTFLPPRSHLICQFVKRHLVTLRREQYVLAQWLRQYFCQDHAVRSVVCAELRESSSYGGLSGQTPNVNSYHTHHRAKATVSRRGDGLGMCSLSNWGPKLARGLQIVTCTKELSLRTRHNISPAQDKCLLASVSKSLDSSQLFGAVIQFIGSHGM